MKIASRIDMFLISWSLLPFVHSADILPGFQSDHSIISLHCKFDKDNPRGKGVWRLNTNFLENAEYITQINQAINIVVVENRNQTPDVLWRILKMSLLMLALDLADVRSPYEMFVLKN